MGDYTLIRAIAEGRLNKSESVRDSVQLELKEILAERDSLQSQLSEARAKCWQLASALDDYSVYVCPTCQSEECECSNNSAMDYAARLRQEGIAT